MGWSQPIDATLLERRCCMGCRRIAGITAQQLRELWSLWRAGEPVTVIAQALQRPDTLVRRALDRTGGISPRERCRAERVLSTNEREEISRGIAARLSDRKIAAKLDRAPSTISRDERPTARLRGARAREISIARAN